MLARYKVKIFIFSHVATQSDCNRGPPLKGETLRLEQISDQSKFLFNMNIMSPTKFAGGEALSLSFH